MARSTIAGYPDPLALLPRSRGVGHPILAWDWATATIPDVEDENRASCGHIYAYTAAPYGRAPQRRDMVTVSMTEHAPPVLRGTGSRRSTPYRGCTALVLEFACPRQPPSDVEEGRTTERGRGAGGIIDAG